MRINLKGGFYKARSAIVDGQRCLNLYPEPNAQPLAELGGKSSTQSAVPVTHYPTPGLTLMAAAPLFEPIRGGYTATNGNQYVVNGNTLYLVNSDFTFSSLGTLTTNAGPISMIDNGQVMILVDGTSSGFRINITSNSFSLITDPGFNGGDVVDYADGYFILNIPGKRQFYLSDVQADTFSTLNFASKEGASDLLVTLGVRHREIWLFGALTTEVYFNFGDGAFPYQRMPGVFIQHGCAAKASVAKFDLCFFWLGQNESGAFTVYKGEGYQAKRISTHALEETLRDYSIVSDAIGFVYQQEGHPFYVLTFPTADKTWVYDYSNDLWHERAFMDANGDLHRIRANCHWAYQKMNLVGDYQTGNIYKLDQNNFTDNGQPILRLRSFPTLEDDELDRRTLYKKLVLDMQTGCGLPSGIHQFPMVNVRWSDTGGRDWGTPVQVPLGAIGDFKAEAVILGGLGIGRRRVIEVSWSAPVDTAINGGWLDAQVLRS